MTLNPKESLFSEPDAGVSELGERLNLLSRGTLLVGLVKGSSIDRGTNAVLLLITNDFQQLRSL
ncbi:MAG: hypothetical protein WBV73_08630 [Phormidium sp.]